MKVTVCSIEYTCTKAVRGNAFVILYNNADTVASFFNVTDFSKFTVTGGDWTIYAEDSVIASAAVLTGGKIVLTVDGDIYNGTLVKFSAPCDCTAVTGGLTIGSKTYAIVDAMGETVTGLAGAWKTGAQISVIIDADNSKAYLQNGAVRTIDGNNRTVQLKRAAKASLPTLSAGELGFATDSGDERLFAGTGTSNLEVQLVRDAVAKEHASQHAKGGSDPLTIGNAVAALYNLESGSTPDEAFTAIKTLLGSAPHIETGSYVGTDSVGANHPNSLTFDFEPKLLVIGLNSSNQSSGTHFISVIDSCRGTTIESSTSTNIVSKTQSGDTWTVAWYAYSSAGYTAYSRAQMNTGGVTYYYVAIG